ncbi:hypothetical protein IG631_11517 [Alternaria alternata]|nr:hypothetical protein IG631_11517 [Alternaria alternata]
MDAGRRSGFKESSTIFPDRYWSAPSNRPNEGSSFSFGGHEGVSIREKVPRHILEKFPALRHPSNDRFAEAVKRFAIDGSITPQEAYQETSASFRELRNSAWILGNSGTRARARNPDPADLVVSVGKSKHDPCNGKNGPCI